MPVPVTIEEAKGEVWQEDQVVLNASSRVGRESEAEIIDLIAKGKALATKMGVHFEVTSAKTGENVEETF